jgi:hypothetical protein
LSASLRQTAQLATRLPRPDSASIFVIFTLRFERNIMLYTIAVVLVILWLLGIVTSYTLGGFIHILIVIAIVVILLRLISGQKPL